MRKLFLTKSGVQLAASPPPAAEFNKEVTVKLHGYADEGLPIEEIIPADLAEVTLVATPEELRRIARFLESCAQGMESNGRSWEHEHLSDKDCSFENSPHFVVFNPECGR